MIKHLFTAICCLTLALSAAAEVPAGYYTTLDNKSEGELKTAIFKLVRNFTEVSSYSALPQYFQKTDVYPGSKRWWDMYSDIPLYSPSFSGLNREHSFPKSWWGGLTDVPAYVDLNHLYPSEAAANMAKSNYPLGTVDMSYTPNFNNGISKVGYAVTGQGGGAKFVFEPADEYKGDFARTYFYMVTAYQDLKWSTSYTWMLQQNLYPTLTPWAINLLLAWHRQDPVSEKETNRNNEVYKIQNNRNPYIDYPELVEYIWGNKKGQVFKLDNAGTSGTPTLITPVQDMALDFGQVALGKAATARLWFNGENMTGKLSLRVYTGDKTYFTIPSSEIATNLINAEDGYWLPITYTPTAEGTHTSRLLISDGGLTGSRGIELHGECLAVPILTACTATAPQDIEADSYTATWTAPAGETIDYYVVTRTMYKGNNATQETLEAEDTQLAITGFSDNDYETYSVQSARLGYLSPMSNVVTVRHSGITDVSADLPLSVIAIDGGIRFVTTVEHTGARIYDATGRLIMTLPTVSNNTDVDLPAGFYLITTDRMPIPAKLRVK